MSSGDNLTTQEEGQDDRKSSHEEICDDDDDDDEEFDYISSQWKDGVEIGLRIQHPHTSRFPLVLNTQLQSDQLAPLFDGTQWAGTRVWKAAILGFEYLVAQGDEHNESSLLELGCGLGVPGMLWERLHPTSRVLLTDQPELVQQLETNLQTNFADENIQAEALTWSRQGILELLERHSKFDICLNCDCIYEPLYGKDAWEALADVLAVLAEVSPSTLLVTSVERRTGDGVDDFLERLEASGHVEAIQRVLRNDDDKHHVIEIYVTQGKGRVDK